MMVPQGGQEAGLDRGGERVKPFDSCIMQLGTWEKVPRLCISNVALDTLCTWKMHSQEVVDRTGTGCHCRQQTSNMVVYTCPQAWGGTNISVLHAPPQRHGHASRNVAGEIHHWKLLEMSRGDCFMASQWNGAAPRMGEYGRPVRARPYV
jgi:hypothetical protein